MVRAVTCLVGTAITQLLLVNKANELINKRIIYNRLNAHRRKIHTGGRGKCAFTFNSAVYEKKLK